MEHPFVAFDLNLIRSRIELLGMDPVTFAQDTGLTLTNLQSKLQPNLISVEKMVQIAHMLDMDISEMIITSRDSSQAEVSPPSPGPLPITTKENEERSDTIFLRAVLAEHECFRLDELADILIWPRTRLLEAIEDLQRQLINTSQKLIRTAESIELIHDSNTLSSTTHRNLYMWRIRNRQLTPHEAQYLLHLVRDAITAPLALITSRPSHNALWNARENGLHDRHLISIGTYRYRAVASAHPDVLFGLRLISNPSSPDEP